MSKNTEIYCFDSSALIQVWNNWYQPDRVPALWDHIKKIADAGRIIVPQAVMDELSNNGKRPDDPVYRWFVDLEASVKKKKKRVVVPESKEIQLEQARLCQAYRGFGGSQIPGEKEYADPWVVATAKVLGATVIAHEREKRFKNDKFRIPYVCVSEGVKVSRMYRLINQSGLTLVAKDLT